MRISTAICIIASLTATDAFTVSTPSATRSTALDAVSRDNFLKQVAGAATAVAVSGIANPLAAFAETEVNLPSGVSYVILKKGDGPEPKIGELAGIRFRAEVLQTGIKVDDIFESPEPYYTRVGSGGLLKGVEEVLPMMVMGDRWRITVPNKLAFGPKGRPSSAGKPRIGNDAIIIFEVEMVSMPGREQELIDLIGDD